MGPVRLMQRFGAGFKAVQPTDQIAFDASLATVKLAGGRSPALADVIPALTPKLFRNAGDSDDTASIQALVNYVAANGLVGRLPGGNYAISQTITLPANAKLVGDGIGFTQILPSQTGSPAFSLTGGSVHLSDLAINWNGAAVGTGATGVLISGVSNVLLSRLTVNGSDVCIEVTNASVIFLRDIFGNIIKSSGLYVHGTPNTAAGAASGIVTDCQLHNFVFAAGAIADPNSGTKGILRISQAVESLVITNGECLFGAIPLLVESTDGTPSDRKMPQFNKISNVFFDSNAQGANLRNCTTFEFDSCWFSTGRSGAGFSGVDLDLCDSISFNQCNLFSCGLHGAIVRAGAKNVVFNVCKAMGNGSSVAAGAANGLHFVAGTSDFTVNACIGNNGLYGSGQQGYFGYVEAGASDRYAFIANRVAANKNAAGIFDGGTGTNKTLLGNY